MTAVELSLTNYTYLILCDIDPQAKARGQAPSGSTYIYPSTPSRKLLKIQVDTKEVTLCNVEVVEFL